MTVRPASAIHSAPRRVLIRPGPAAAVAVAMLVKDLVS